MFFSLIRLRETISPREAALLSDGTGYHVHRLIWNLFGDGPDRRRDFLFRYELVRGWPTFYTVSNREPQDDSGLWLIESKIYEPKLSTGQRLSFSLRVNPVCSKRDEEDRQHRHDIVMEAKRFFRLQGVRINEAEIIQEVGERWLMERCNRFGFSVLAGNFRVDGYQQHKFVKKKGTQLIRFSTLDFNGNLIVDEPDVLMRECLFSGMGPAKGFGCGLMLIRRV